MTKAELIAAIATAPADTHVYLDFGGSLHPLAVVEAYDNTGAGEWFICFEPPEGVVRVIEEDEDA